MRKLALHWQILIAIIMAVLIGLVVRSYTTDDFAPNILGVPFVSIFEYIGEIFLNGLKMIIVPLITSSIIVGVAGIGSGGNLGALGGKTLLFYATTTLAAILVGLIVINLVKPGIADGVPAGEMLALEAPRTSLPRWKAKASTTLPKSSSAWCRPISSKPPRRVRCSA